MLKMLKNNLSKIEKLLLFICVFFVGIRFLFFEEIEYQILLLFSIIILLSTKNNNTTANYLLGEKIKKMIVHFLLFWMIEHIINFILFGEEILNFSLFLFMIIFIIVILMPFFGILKMIHKFSKSDLNKDLSLYRQLPQNIKPAIISYMMNGKIVNRNVLSATLLDLIREGHLDIKNKDIIFDDVSNGKIDIKLSINRNKKNLLSYEQYLINWFSKSSKNCSEIDMGNLKKMFEDSSNLKQDYFKWKELVEKEASKQDLYDACSKLSKFSNKSLKISRFLFLFSFILVMSYIILSLISYAIPNVFIIADCIYFTHFFITLLAIILNDLRLPDEYLSEIGKENIKKWNGFIKFLEEYSIIDKRKFEEIYIWQEYMVYGVAFGISKKVIDTMDESYGLSIMKLD